MGVINYKLKNYFNKYKSKHAFINNILLFIGKIKYYFRSLVSIVRNKNSTFLDANLIISNKEDVDKRIKKLPKLLKPYFVTDIINKEVEDLQKSSRIKIFTDKYEVISFSELREKYPDVCPVYYNFIAFMYNPANLASPEFPIHLIQSLKLRGRDITKEQKELYNQYMDKLTKDAKNELDKYGKPKKLLAKHMDKSILQYFQKRLKNKKSENLMNDYKNISLILLYTILNKKNTTLITADRDVLAIILTLVEGISQYLSFHYLILKTLSEEDKIEIIKNNKKITRFIELHKFIDQYLGRMTDLLNPYWKKNFVSFKIKLWDQEKQKYVEDFVINFDDIIMESIINLHGPLACPFARNYTHGNWLHYQFWPPPPKTPYIKIMVWVKKIVNFKNVYIPNNIHENNCKYATDDKNNNLKEYYGFWL